MEVGKIRREGRREAKREGHRKGKRKGRIGGIKMCTYFKKKVRFVYLVFLSFQKKSKVGGEGATTSPKGRHHFNIHIK